jgi:hypothetical protein
MPYNETIIENIPIDWLHWYSGGKFPNPLEFKPFYPKWWEKIKSQCRICLHICQVKDVEVFDRFVNETKFNLEYHISFICPKCKNKSYARQISFKVFEDQIREHIKKHSTPIPNHERTMNDTPHLRHRWHDGCLFIHHGKKIQWRLQWCKCGKERVKPKSKQPTNTNEI